MLIFGTRPEAIKMAPLVKEFQKYPEQFTTRVCVTGQHRQMLDQVLDLFEISPEIDLNIMKEGQDLFDITSKIILGLRGVFLEKRPDMVFVHGDTTTSTAAALAAFYSQIPIAHIEAGLRTHNRYSPWPEEMNRQITGRLAQFHFAPTPLSKENLIKENILESDIQVTGNTVIDALLLGLSKIHANIHIQMALQNSLKSSGYDTTRLDIGGRRMVLITGHRRENFGNGFLNICRAIKRLAVDFPNVDFVYPMHLNPNVRKPIDQIFTDASLENVFFIEPLEYLSFIFLMKRCSIVLTDSGGIQEEAPGIGKPVLVMRETTERPEAILSGTVKLVGTNAEIIYNEVAKLLSAPETYEKMSKAVNPYGDGKACERIVSFFMELYG